MWNECLKFPSKPTIQKTQTVTNYDILGDIFKISGQRCDRMEIILFETDKMFILRNLTDILFH